MQQLDERLMQRLARSCSAVLDRSLVGIIYAANYSRLWLAIAGGLAAFDGRQGRRAAERGITAIVIPAAVANGPAKLLVRRRRPSARAWPALVRVPRSTSFHSGHRAAAFAFATVTSAELPLLASVLLALAGAGAYSRVHTGVHYPSDVAAGAAIGVGPGPLASRLPRWVRRAPPAPGRRADRVR